MITLTKNSATREDGVLESKHLKVCLVTNRRSLFEALGSSMGFNGLQIRHRLADLAVEHDCGFFIVDTSINDMHIWPAPLLANPDTYSKPWLFLVSRVSDTSHLQLLPHNARFLDREHLTTDALISFIKKQTDPELGKRIADVHYLDNINSFFIRMENGRPYILPVSDLPEADSSGVTRWLIARNRSYFSVTQESGNRFEVPWDDILFHCEPEYRYYKGKQSQSANRDNLNRIGLAVRRLRETKGYSIQELAQKAGMKRPNLSRLEHGKHQPSLEILERIAEALEVPVAEIIARNSPR